jgi:hypothetical protein
MVGCGVNHLSAELDGTACQLRFDDRTLRDAALKNRPAAHGSSQAAIG